MDVTTGRSSRGTALSAIALVGSAVLVLSLFLDWYEISGGGESFSFSGWRALEFGDVAFVMILFLALAAVLRPGAISIGGFSTSLALGLFAALLVVMLVVTTTPTLELFTAAGGATTDLKPGVFVAAGGVALLLVAGVLEYAGAAENRKTSPATPTTPGDRQ